MKIKTSELTGRPLSWAMLIALHGNDRQGRNIYGDLVDTFMPPITWAECGPIIELEWLCVDRLLNGQWLAAKRTEDGDSMLFAQSGRTPLIAAMRCFVTSKLGDEVDAPEELAS